MKSLKLDNLFVKEYGLKMEQNLKNKNLSFQSRTLSLRDKPVLTLSVAAELLGVHPRTLMFYEKEKLITPARTATGRRLFSQADLSLLQFIRYLTEKRRVNTSGIRIILDLLEKTKSTNSTLKKEVFGDFEEKKLI